MPALESVRKSGANVMKSKPAQQDVEFTYYAPNAKKACLAGKFNSWNTKSLPMKKDNNGTWRVKVKLPPGKHEYKYFVDNAWCETVPGAEMIQNAFGSSDYVMDVK